MKKTVKIAGLLTLIVMIFFAFTSCGVPNYGYLRLLPKDLRAAKIMEIMNTRLEEADSYTVTGRSKVDGMVGESGVKTTVLVEERMSGQNTPNPTKTNKIVQEYDYFYDSMDMEIEILEGYQDGQMYRYVKANDGFESKITSVATKEEFEEYNEIQSGEDFVIDFSKSEVSSEVAKDGSWIVTATILNPEKNYEITNFEMMTEGYEVSSIELKITVKKDFSGWENVINYVFEKIDGYNENITDRYTASVEVVSVISDINSTETEKQDLSDYFVCSDITIPTRMNFQFNEILEATKGKFTLYIQQKGNIGSSRIWYTEKDTIEFGNCESGFYYSIDCDTSADDVKITYVDGEKDENGEKKDSSDAAEKLFLNRLFTSGGYNEQYITKITEDPNDSSKQIISIDMGEAFLRSLNGASQTFNKGSIKITVTFEGEKISVVETEIKAWSTKNSNANYTVTNYCKFIDDSSEAGDTVA